MNLGDKRGNMQSFDGSISNFKKNPVGSKRSATRTVNGKFVSLPELWPRPSSKYTTPFERESAVVDIGMGLQCN